MHFVFNRENNKHKRLTPIHYRQKKTALNIVAANASVGSLLYGYNTGAMSGALLGIDKVIDLTPAQRGFMVAVILLGAIVGSVFHGYLVDRKGRRKLLLLSNIFYIVGPILSAFGPANYIQLCVGRFITGIGVGVSCIGVFLYISEISPPQWRGSRSLMAQVFVTIGFLLQYLFGFFLVDYKYGWRILLLLPVVPAVVQSVISLIRPHLLPETPHYLMSKGKRDEAIVVVVRFSDVSGVDDFIAEIDQTLKANQNKAAWTDLFQKKYKIVLAIAILLSALQQLSGINVVVYYSGIIFSTVGFSDSFSLLISAISVIPQLVIAFVEMWVIDKWGRRTMLFCSLFGLTVGCLLLSFAFFDPDRPFLSPYRDDDLNEVGKGLAVVGMLLYRISFSMGLGPIPLLLASEILPSFIRGKAMAVAGIFNWLAMFAIIQTFPVLNDNYGAPITFLTYAAVILLTFVFVHKCVPETKAKSLEELEKLLITNNNNPL